jgi:hypothetical protein
LREEHFLEDVFGVTSRLEANAFLLSVQKHAPYVVNGADMRAKFLEVAGLTSKY